MKKILVGYLIDGKHSGIDKYLLNFLKVTSEKNVQIDFLTNEIDKDLENQLQLFGAKLYEIPTLKHPLQQIKKIKQLANNNSYDIAYFNISECINITGIIGAYLSGIKNIIIHSHNAGIGGQSVENPIKRNIRYCLHQIGKCFLYRFGTSYVACSKKAGEWLFPKKIVESNNFQVINNAIQVDKFEYCQKTRTYMREELQIENKFVIGHVGNFCYQKNQHFLIDIFADVIKKEKNAHLLLVGIGPDEQEIKEKVNELGLDVNVSFLGLRNDVNKVMQAMDIFVLPSRFEGLPIVGIEATISGLPCIFSDTISEEVKISENSHFCSLKDAPSIWADKILQYKNFQREKFSIVNSSYCFDLEKQKAQLLSLIGEGEIENEV